MNRYDRAVIAAALNWEKTNANTFGFGYTHAELLSACQRYRRAKEEAQGDILARIEERKILEKGGGLK
jgi:hypothetical protein